MTKIDIKLQKFKSALKALEAIYNKPMQEDKSNIDATIQRFEFTFELFWKLLKELFYEKGLNIQYPKDVIKEAYANKIIENEHIWLKMLKDRNLTSHTYDEYLAEEIFISIQSYVPLFMKFLDKIEDILCKL